MKQSRNSVDAVRLADLRRHVERYFQPDTAYPGTKSSIPSAGHCAIVSAIALLKLGGALASATVKGESHWFNRLSDGSQFWDVDLTGDQFGLPSVQIKPAGQLYSDAVIRSFDALNVETLERARRLATRANMQDVAGQISDALAARLPAVELR